MVNKQLLFLFVFLFPILIVAQNEAPTVENVSFSQRNDGSYLVDVYYDVLDLDGDSLTITMLVSNDEGISWNFSCNNTSGDVGNDIPTGTGKQIIWDFASEHPDTCCNQFIIKIIADDNIGKPCPGLPTVTDHRNGEIYETVLIGEQCWLNRNLNVGIIEEDISRDNGIIEKHCYNNNVDYCDAYPYKYGGLYEWYEAMQYTTNEGAQGICPDGFHIPSKSEFEILIASVYNNSNTLKAVGEGWDAGTGTNISAFSALLGGRYLPNGSFDYLTTVGVFWTSTEGTNNYGMNIMINGFNSDIEIQEGTLNSYGFSVRCLKN